jgi:thiosulfate/3-mercaptopyruvate sulfurtransferase
VEGWVKAYIGGDDGTAFLNDEVHMGLGCIGCHGGKSGENTKDVAHEGLRADPSEGPDNKCADLCHNREMGHFWEDSVHATQIGYIELFEQRSGLDFHDNLDVQEGFQKDCASCHASCGDCHISQPKNVGGGLVSAHKINRRPDRVRNCQACHGSRVGDEYTGVNSYANSDVHWLPNLMHCADCHSGAEMHGTPGAAPTHRYEEPAMPQCRDCHADDIAPGSNDWHDFHVGEGAHAGGRALQCNVCHSQTYKSCNGCHVGEGITGSSYPTFKIGRNPIPDLRDVDYVVLRHVPVAEDTFAGWGVDQLQNYSSVETWKYASPHNVRASTALTDTTGGRTCFDACHNTEDSSDGFFLRASDLEGLSPAEREANQNVIVPDGPPTSW